MENRIVKARSLKSTVQEAMCSLDVGGSFVVSAKRSTVYQIICSHNEEFTETKFKVRTSEAFDAEGRATGRKLIRVMRVK